MPRRDAGLFLCTLLSLFEHKSSVLGNMAVDGIKHFCITVARKRCDHMGVNTGQKLVCDVAVPQGIVVIFLACLLFELLEAIVDGICGPRITASVTKDTTLGALVAKIGNDGHRASSGEVNSSDKSSFCSVFIFDNSSLEIVVNLRSSQSFYFLGAATRIPADDQQITERVARVVLAEKPREAVRRNEGSATVTLRLFHPLDWVERQPAIANSPIETTLQSCDSVSLRGILPCCVSGKPFSDMTRVHIRDEKSAKGIAEVLAEIFVTVSGSDCSILVGPSKEVIEKSNNRVTENRGWCSSHHLVELFVGFGLVGPKGDLLAINCGVVLLTSFPVPDFGFACHE